jgi:hypothetical protein
LAFLALQILLLITLLLLVVALAGILLGVAAGLVGIYPVVLVQSQALRTQ